MRITDFLQEPKYVAFLDVLGFKELVQQKGEKLNDYFEIIQLALEDIREDKAEIESQIVSDSIILACTLTNENLGLLLRAVQTIQSRCALKNIWLRGAITTGEILFSREPNVVIGNGLTQAYLMESQEKYPRIIINPAIVQSFDTREKFIKTYNKKNMVVIFQPNYSSNFIENDAIFVTFLERIVETDLDNLDIIYNHVKSEIYKGQPNYQKYLWLKNYFTESLSNLKDGYMGKRPFLSRQPVREEFVCEAYMQHFQSL